MKTFEEAVQVVSPAGSVERVPEMIAQVSEHCARNREVIAEILDSATAQGLLVAALAASPCVPAAMMTMFVQGVLVGMEMERTETGVAMP